MLDFDLAVLYGIETKVLKQAVRRNMERFPIDFMFELELEELVNLRSHFVTSSEHGGLRYRPFAFTEQGVAMLSSVLRSKRAIEINILIMRTFVLIRQYALSHKELSEKLRDLEEKFADVYETLGYLLDNNRMEKEQVERKRIGYLHEKEL